MNHLPTIKIIAQQQNFTIVLIEKPVQLDSNISRKVETFLRKVRIHQIRNKTDRLTHKNISKT